MGTECVQVGLGGRTTMRLVLGTVAGMALLAGCAERTVTQRRTLEVTAAPGGGLRVESANGGVTVLADDGSEVRVDAEVRARRDRVDRVVLRAEHDEAGTLWVSAEWPEGKRLSGEGASFTIEGPAFEGQTIRTSNGAIRLEGQRGRADLETSNGAIRVETHAGAVQASSSNGSIRVGGSSGALRLSTSNGRIRVFGADGPVQARSSNGSVEVQLAPDSAGPVDLESSNGSLTLTAGPGLRGEIVAQTSNGSIEVQGVEKERVERGSRSRARVVLGEGESSMLRTSNASVTITLREGGARKPEAAAQAPVRPVAQPEPLAGSGDLPTPR